MLAAPDRGAVSRATRVCRWERARGRVILRAVDGVYELAGRWRRCSGLAPASWPNTRGSLELSVKSRKRCGGTRASWLQGGRRRGPDSSLSSARSFALCLHGVASLWREAERRPRGELCLRPPVPRACQFSARIVCESRSRLCRPVHGRRPAPSSLPCHAGLETVHVLVLTASARQGCRGVWRELTFSPLRRAMAPLHQRASLVMRYLDTGMRYLDTGMSSVHRYELSSPV
jgi:hypothetical protein